MDRRSFFSALRGVAAAALVIAASATAVAQTRAKDPFTVAGVDVDVRAANAQTAQAQAIAQGQRAALERLVRRLMLPEDLAARGGAPATDAATLDRLVQSFSVANERRSATRYIASLSVVFDAAATRDWLRLNQMPFVEARALPLVVFPSVVGGDAAANALWQAGWLGGGFEHELAPLFADATQPAQWDWPSVKDRVEAAGAGGAIFAFARAGVSGTNVTVTVDLTQIDGSGQAALGQVAASAPVGDNQTAAFAAAYAKAAAAAADRAQIAWKQRAVVRAASTQRLAVSARYGSLEEWNRIRSALRTSSMISDVRIDAIAVDGAWVQITHSGTVDQLRVELRQLNLALEPDATGATLTLRR